MSLADLQQLFTVHGKALYSNQGKVDDEISSTLSDPSLFIL